MASKTKWRALYDLKEGAQELERCAKMGLKGAMIWCSPPADQPYSSPLYDPFWAAAQELDMPVSLHAITGIERIQWEYGAEKRAMRQTVTPHEIEKSFSILILSGVLERFPRLKIVSAENNTVAGCPTICICRGFPLLPNFLLEAKLTLMDLGLLLGLGVCGALAKRG